MADHNEIVDKIRAFMQSSDQTRQDFLPGLAGAYAEACADVNQRLAQCNRLLQQGLRSEAIHLAEDEPRLLDAVTTLDFPERAAWEEEIVAVYGLAASPPLTVEMARFLNEAYAEEDPLQDLLRSHRRLALARAPLPSRIAVMRRLAALDSANPLWPEDVRTFEKSRLRQIQAEAAELAARRDLGGLQLMVKELEAPDWSEPPPAVLLQGIKKSAALFRRSQARSELETLEIALNNAFAAFDVERGRQARRRWEEVVTIAGLPADDPVRDRAEPALQWLAEQDRREQEERDYQAALAELERALDEDLGDRTELERLAHAVARHERGMPEPLERRLRTRQENLELAATRRGRLIVAASVAAFLVLGGTTAYVVVQQARAREVAQAIAAIDRMLADDSVEEAVGFVDKLGSTNAGLFGSPALVEARSRVEAARKGEAERAGQFADALQAAEGVPASVETPTALEAARKLARLDGEKAAVERLARRHDVEFRADRAQRDKAMLPRIDSLSQAIWRAEDVAGKSDDPQAVEDALFKARGELAALAADVPMVSDNLRTRVALLGKKIDTLRSELDRRQGQRRLEDEITRSLANTANGEADSGRYVAALESFTKAFPDAPRAASFRQVLGERPLWDDAMAHLRLSAGWSGPLTRLDAAGARARAAECRKFLADHPNSPDVADIAAYQKLVEAIARRAEGSDSPRERLRKLFADAMVDQLWVVQYKDSEEVRSRMYYLRQRPPRTPLGQVNSSVRIRYLTDFDDTEKPKTLLNGVVLYSGESPQTKLAAQVREIIKNDSSSDRWEKSLVEIADKLRRDDKIDPILKVALLDRVLSYGMDGSELLRDAFKGYKEALDQADIDINIPWMDPESPAAERLRPRADTVVRELPDLAEAGKAAEAYRLRIEERLGHAPRPVGWLSSEGGRWQVRASGLAADAGDLCVVVVGDNKKGVWRKVGTIEGGAPELAGDDPELAEGRPVFLFRRPVDRS